MHSSATLQTPTRPSTPPPPLSIPPSLHSRAAQAAETGGNEKEAVKAYFNNVGFDRWSRIYSASEDVNSVQRDIREGHAQTVDKVLAWLGGAADLAGVSVCDAGCGTGSLAIPLAFKGATITATDISGAMAAEAARRYEAEAAAPGAPARPLTPPTFAAASLDELSGGPWDVVTCIDVLIHYPQAKVDAMLASLVGKASKKVVLSFAPSTPYYEVRETVESFFFFFFFFFFCPSAVITSLSFSFTLFPTGPEARRRAVPQGRQGHAGVPAQGGGRGGRAQVSLVLDF